MAKLQSAVTLIQRRESTIPAIKFLVFIHSARPYKNYVPKCSQFLHELIIYFFFFYLVCNKRADTLSKKKMSGSHPHSIYIYPEQPHSSSTHCKNKKKIISVKVIGLMRKEEKIPPLGFEPGTLELQARSLQIYHSVCGKWSS